MTEIPCILLLWLFYNKNLVKIPSSRGSRRKMRSISLVGTSRFSWENLLSVRGASHYVLIEKDVLRGDPRSKLARLKITTNMNIGEITVLSGILFWIPLVVGLFWGHSFLVAWLDPQNKNSPEKASGVILKIVPAGSPSECEEAVTHTSSFLF